jgi:hypothetical protein
MKKSGYLFALVIEHNGLDLMGQKPGPSLRTFFRSDIEHNGFQYCRFNGSEARPVAENFLWVGRCQNKIYCSRVSFPCETPRQTSQLSYVL